MYFYEQRLASRYPVAVILEQMINPYYVVVTKMSPKSHVHVALVTAPCKAECFTPAKYGLVGSSSDVLCLGVGQQQRSQHHPFLPTVTSDITRDSWNFLFLNLILIPRTYIFSTLTMNPE